MPLRKEKEMKILNFIMTLLNEEKTKSNAPATQIDYSRASRQLADYFEKALQECPDYYNLMRTSASGIIVEFLDSTNAKVTVQKKNCLGKENPRNVSLRWIPNINDILSNIRLDAEYQLEATRADTLNKLVELHNQCIYVDDPNLWNTKSAEFTIAYWRYFHKIEHLLCGVIIIDYSENDGAFIFNVVIDNKFRVPTALA